MTRLKKLPLEDQLAEAITLLGTMRAPLPDSYLGPVTAVLLRETIMSPAVIAVILMLRAQEEGFLQ